jgi:hypothetical protein
MAVNLNVTELDFDLIKENFKTYLKSQDKYTDYDFDGSGLNILLDILAYNTHYNAMTAHMALNEAFLDSAQIRGNVVSHAKLLGYVPRSRTAPTAIVNVTVNNPIGTPVPSTLTLERGTKFVTVVDGEEYPYVVVDSVNTVYNTANDQFTFEDINIKQGTFKTIRYRIDDYIDNQRFVIPDDDVDISTLRVRIKDNDNSSNYSIYTKFSSLINVDFESKVYFLQENSNSKYEVYFGDGIIGTKPQSDNIVELEYVYTSADRSNGARNFDIVGQIGGNSDITLETVAAASGGSDRESIESIRFNSPLTYITQNRAVTADDYKAIIQREYGDIDAISVWGGEDNSPPDYGKVYISIKPKTSATLTQIDKDFISQNVLKGKNVVSITPVMVDPEYTYISIEAFFKYNPNLTDRKLAELTSLISSSIQTYNDDELKRFDGVFRYSKFLRTLDSTDPSILNSYARVYMFKEVIPSNTQMNYYDLSFASPIYVTSSDESVMSSTPFLLNGIVHYFADVPIENSNNRQIIIYKVINDKRSIVNANAGTIYAASGRVVISSFKPDTTDKIRLTFIPNSNDLAPKRNQLLEISMDNVTVVGQVDTIAVSGSAGTVNYQTTPRHK